MKMSVSPRRGAQFEEPCRNPPSLLIRIRASRLGGVLIFAFLPEAYKTPARLFIMKMSVSPRRGAHFQESYINPTSLLIRIRASRLDGVLIFACLQEAYKTHARIFIMKMSVSPRRGADFTDRGADLNTILTNHQIIDLD